MARVERGNVVLHITEDEVQHYLQLGYNLTDDKGNIIKEAIPHDVFSLQAAYTKHIERISQLEAEVARLTEENMSLITVKKAPTKSTKS